MTPNLRVNVQPHEILFSFTEVVVESDQPLDQQSAQAGILVRGQRGEVVLSKDSTRASWTPLAPLPMGDHTLAVSKLATRSGDEVAGDLEIPFFITDSQALVPDDLVVESMVRLAVHELGTTRLGADRRPEGPFIEVMKASERATGAPRPLAFDQDGKAIDADEIFAAIDRARADKYGKLHPSLCDQLEEVGDGIPVEAAVWLRGPQSTFNRLEMAEDAPLETPPEVLEHRRQTAEVNERFIAALAQKGVKEATADRLAPVVYARLTGEQIQELTADAEVSGVFLNETEGITDLVDSIAVARTDHAHNQGFQGSNIRVAVWEESPDDTTDLDIAAAFDPNPGPLEISPHARLTHAIIKNSSRKVPKRADTRPAGSMKILVVEDDPMIRSFIRRGLTEQGFAVEVCGDGDQGLSHAISAAFDAIVLDVMLPGRDGLSLLRELRERKNAVPVILLTARSSLAERVEGLGLGADDYLTKPFYMEELIARLHAVVRRSSGEPVSVLRVADLVVDPQPAAYLKSLSIVISFELGSSDVSVIHPRAIRRIQPSLPPPAAFAPPVIISAILACRACSTSPAEAVARLAGISAGDQAKDDGDGQQEPGEPEAGLADRRIGGGTRVNHGNLLRMG